MISLRRYWISRSCSVIARNFGRAPSTSRATVEPVLDGLWLVRDWIPRLGLSVIWGPSGAGKSHLAADMACHVARGETWSGNPVEQGLVVYVALEGHGSIGNRIAALARTFGDAPVWFIRARLSLADAARHVDELVKVIVEEAAAKGLPMRWVIIDTLARAMAGMEENSAKDMGAAIAGMETISSALDCAVTVIHHSGKDTSRGERGSNSLRGAAEASIEVSAEGRGATKVITAAAGKMREGEDGATFLFRLRQVELGPDKWGRMVTSCTVEPLDEADIASRRAKATLERLTAQQRDGLEALRDAAERTGRRITNSPDYPRNRPIVTEGEWEAEFYRCAFSDSDKQDTKRKAFKRVRDVLREKRVVGAYNGHFWTVQP